MNLAILEHFLKYSSNVNTIVPVDFDSQTNVLPPNVYFDNDVEITSERRLKRLVLKKPKQFVRIHDKNTITVYNLDFETNINEIPLVKLDMNS